jgi:hypothetical protein
MASSRTGGRTTHKALRTLRRDLATGQLHAHGRALSEALPSCATPTASTLLGSISFSIAERLVMTSYSSCFLTAHFWLSLTAFDSRSVDVMTLYTCPCLSGSAHCTLMTVHAEDVLLSVARQHDYSYSCSLATQGWFAHLVLLRAFALPTTQINTPATAQHVGP